MSESALRLIKRSAEFISKERVKELPGTFGESTFSTTSAARGHNARSSMSFTSGWREQGFALV